ncbi:hypothetical protein MKX01_010062 [Papaver californicum]|nr:hypothetical protein MKX01_010062 [Papaver californicum]
MFGSTSPFGQSSTSPFGSQQQSVFGQNNNTASNPFAPKPFGSTNPFGSQTGGSIFGGNSTGVFGGTQASSPLPSTPTFGNTASAPSFGGSVPSFGSPTPAFGSGTSSFGGSSLFGQKPAFGGFGSTTPSQSSPFGGSTFQQTQSAFGGNAFGSSAPFGAPSQPAFGTSSSPGFGATNTPAFGAATTPAFGSQPTAAFGAATTSAFGSQPTSTFGSGGGFGTQAFGSISNSAFGATSAASTFGTSTTPSFGAQPFSFGTSPAFGQTNSGFGSSPFGSTPSAFGAQTSTFGTQTTTPSTFGSSGAFGQQGFSGGQQQRGGSRVVAYAPTVEADQSGAQSSAKLESISAMPVYKEKSHEELRWEDYQLGDKGGPNLAGQPSSIGGFGTPTTPQPNPFGTTQTNPFTSTTTANPFGQKTTGFPSSTPGFSTSGFGSSTPSNPFMTSSSASTSVFGQLSTPAFSPSTFGATPSSTPSTTPSPFNPTPGTINTFGTGMTIGTTPAFQQTNNPFGQTSSSTFAPSTTSSFAQPTNMFSSSNSGFGNNSFNSTLSQPSSGNSLFGQTNPSQQSQPAFSFPSFGQQQQPTVSTGGFGASTSFGATPSVFNSASNAFGQNAFGQQSIGNQSNTVAPQPAAVATNPFGTLPTMPQVSIGHTGSAPSIQYGISNMPVVDKPAPVRVSSLLTSRHLSQRRIRLPARRSHPKNDGTRVPFFSDDEEAPSTPKADALFIPRENPRALVIRPLEHWTSRTSAEKSKDTNNIPLHENGKLSEKDSGSSLNGSINQEKHKSNPSMVENGHDKERTQPVKSSQKANGVHEDHSKNTQNGDSYITLNGHRAGEAAIVYEHGADIEVLMPKLRHSDYYTEPRIQELAAKERAEPGFCRRVKDFVVGRHGYGSIKFAGETDVRNLDLESLVKFNNREVIVYLDESKKPPVGQGLNKAAVVTLLNIKCFDKKTGEQYMDGVKVEKYKEMLMKKARDQGAEFVSYDPIKGEWKFRVNHFSRYMLDDADEEAGVQVVLF